MLTKDRSNNFDFLRLIFSIMVVVCHSFYLANESVSLIDLRSPIAFYIGDVAVKCFFVLSGYFIFTSLQNSRTVLHYLWKRSLRLFPALLVVLLLTLCWVPFVYEGLSPLFYERTYWTYFFNNIALYPVQFEIHGVFDYNPFPYSINGSLWTLCYEWTLYLSLLILFAFRKSKYVSLALLCLYVLFFYLTNASFTSLDALLLQYFNLEAQILYEFACFFFAGAFLASFNINVYIKSYYCLIGTAIGLLIAVLLHWFAEISVVLLPLFLIQIGKLNFNFVTEKLRQLGDLSYGIYIYSFVIQQSFIFYFSLNAYELTLYTLGVAFLFAYFSWHVIEKKALSFKL